MKRTLLFLLVLSGMTLFACRETPPAATGGKPSATAKPAELTIVAMGDSLTAGLGLDERDSYPAQLERRLRDAGHQVRVVNAGVSGETSSDALSRLEWVLSLAPDILILETGANDGLRGLDPAVPRANIDKILTILQEKKVPTIVAGMKMVWNLGPLYVAEFNRIYPELAGRYDVLFLPFFLEGVATVPALNQQDGLHPNAKGYQVVVDALYPLVVQAIEQHRQRH